MTQKWIQKDKQTSLCFFICISYICIQPWAKPWNYWGNCKKLSVANQMKTRVPNQSTDADYSFCHIYYYKVQFIPLPYLYAVKTSINFKRHRTCWCVWWWSWERGSPVIRWFQKKWKKRSERRKHYARAGCSKVRTPPARHKQTGPITIHCAAS